MSYQPPSPEPGAPDPAPYLPPAPTAYVPAPAPYAPAPQPASAPQGGGRRKLPLLLGAVLLVGGIGAAVAGVVLSSSRLEDGVRQLARAPVGCTTTLEFDKTGTFNVFLETKGTLSDPLKGDCAAKDQYDRGDDDAPDVTLTLKDGNDEEVTIEESSGPSYDAAGFVGSAIGKVTIEEAGTFRLKVDSDSDDFAIALGKDPDGDATTLKTIGLAAGGAAALLGLVLLLLGMRRRPAPAPVGVPPSPWNAGPAAAPSVPGYVAPPPAGPPTDVWSMTQPAAPAPPPTEQLPAASDGEPPPAAPWGAPQV